MFFLLFLQLFQLLPMENLKYLIGKITTHFRKKRRRLGKYLFET